jgi:hypothetical protein
MTGHTATNKPGTHLLLVGVQTIMALVLLPLLTVFLAHWFTAGARIAGRATLAGVALAIETTGAAEQMQAWAAMLISYLQIRSKLLAKQALNTMALTVD